MMDQAMRFSASPWAHWNHIANCLDSIEGNAKWIEQYAARVEYAVQRLPERPKFETRAADQLEKSIAKLATCLALCRAALEAYDKAPFMDAAE